MQLAFQICSKKAGGRLQYFNSNITNATLTFDILLCMDVFEHVDDYMGFLRGLKSKTEVTVFRIPLDLSINNLLRKHQLRKIRNAVGHIHYFTGEIALSTLQDCGYEIIDSKYVKGDNLSLKSKLLSLIRSPFFWLNPDLSARLFGGYSLVVLAK